MVTRDTQRHPKNKEIDVHGRRKYGGNPRSGKDGTETAKRRDVGKIQVRPIKSLTPASAREPPKHVFRDPLSDVAGPFISVAGVEGSPFRPLDSVLCISSLQRKVVVRATNIHVYPSHLLHYMYTYSCMYVPGVIFCPSCTRIGGFSLAARYTSFYYPSRKLVWDPMILSCYYAMV